MTYNHSSLRSYQHSARPCWQCSCCQHRAYLGDSRRQAAAWWRGAVRSCPVLCLALKQQLGTRLHLRCTWRVYLGSLCRSQCAGTSAGRLMRICTEGAHRQLVADRMAWAITIRKAEVPRPRLTLSCARRDAVEGAPASSPCSPSPVHLGPAAPPPSPKTAPSPAAAVAAAARRFSRSSAARFLAFSIT